MSVRILEVEDLGMWAAIAVHLKLVDFGRAVHLAKLMSNGNYAAYNGQYNESENASEVSEDEIEKVALDRLAKKDFISGGSVNLAYNCYDNEGVFYYGGAFMKFHANDKSHDGVNELIDMDEKINEFYRAEERRAERAAEDNVAYSEVGKLPVLSATDFAAMMEERKATGLIVASFSVDESDSMTDYYGGRTSRHVVIGFATGSRTSFPQMRKAAAMFPPTSNYGPGHDQFFVSLVWDHNYDEDPGRAYFKWDGGSWSTKPVRGQGIPFHWYSSDYAACQAGMSYEFSTQAEAEEFVAANEPKRGTEWHIGVVSFEHRENYSMGGGNYLGHDRYNGWKVKTVNYKFGPCEYFAAPVAEKAKKPKKVSVAKPVESVSSVAVDYAANV